MTGNVGGVRLFTACVTAAVAIGSTPARAADAVTDAPTEMVARERPATSSFYGWQILATGEAGGIVAAAATLLPDSPMNTLPSTMGFLIGMPFYVLGGPATHWTHGEFHKGLISLGGNFALPVLGGLVGQSVRCAPSDAASDCGTRGFFTGFAIALVTVPLVDAFVLGWESILDDDPAPSTDGRAAHDATRSRRRARETRAADFRMTPAWSLGPKGELAFGLTGRF
jgi:hypothetical protein